MQPEVERRGHCDASSFEVEHVVAPTRDAGALQDDVAGAQRFDAAAVGDEHLVAKAVDIVDDDELARASQERCSGASFEAEAENTDAPSGEVSEASGPEHG